MYSSIFDLWSFQMYAFERSDYSLVVKLCRKHDLSSWRWEIHRAGRSNAVERSSFEFQTIAAAKKEGRQALKQFLFKLYGDFRDYSQQ